MNNSPCDLYPHHNTKLNTFHHFLPILKNFYIFFPPQINSNKWYANFLVPHYFATTWVAFSKIRCGGHRWVPDAPIIITYHPNPPRQIFCWPAPPPITVRAGVAANSQATVPGTAVPHPMELYAYRPSHRRRSVLVVLTM